MGKTLRMYWVKNSKETKESDLKSASGLEGGGIVDHLKDEGPAGAHLDLTDVESEAEEGLEQGALAVGLPAEGHDLGDRELLAEGHGSRLQAVVGLEPGLEGVGVHLGGGGGAR